MAKPALGLPCAPPPSMVNLTRTGAGRPPRHWPRSSGVALPDSQMNLRSVSRRASRVLLGATLVFVALGAVSATAMAAPVSGLALPTGRQGRSGSVRQQSLPAARRAAGTTRPRCGRRRPATATTTSRMLSAFQSRTRSAASRTLLHRTTTTSARHGRRVSDNCSSLAVAAFDRHRLVRLPGRPGGHGSTSSINNTLPDARGRPFLAAFDLQREHGQRLLRRGQ